MSQSSNEQVSPANDPANLNPQLYGRYASPTRILCGALILPTISTIVGKILFSSIKNNFHRTILGGLTFVVVKGALNIYHKQKLHIRYSTRKILDYNDENIRTYVNKTRIQPLTVVPGVAVARSGSSIQISTEESGVFEPDPQHVV